MLVHQDQKIASNLIGGTSIGRLEAEESREVVNLPAVGYRFLQNDGTNLWIDNGLRRNYTLIFRWIFHDGAEETKEFEINPLSAVEFTVPEGIVITVRDNEKVIKEVGLHLENKFSKYVYDVFGQNQYKIETRTYK